MTKQPKGLRNKAATFKPVSAKMISLIGEMSEETKQMAIRYQFYYSIMGLLLGLTCMILGIFLFFNGISDSTSWTAKIFGMNSQISDAGPGAMLFVIGLFVVIITRFGVRAQK